MADDFWSGLGGLLGSGNADLYGDLLTDKQRQSLLFKEISGGLGEISRRAAEAGKPSLVPGGKGWLGAALSGYGAGADAAGEGVLKTMQTAQALRKAKRDQELTEQYFLPLLRDLTAKEKQHGLPPGTLTAGVPTAPPGTPAAPLTPTAPPGTTPGAGGPAGVPTPPAAPVSMGLPQAGMSPFGLPDGPAPAPVLSGGPPTQAERLEWNKTVGPGKQYLPIEDWVVQHRAGAPAGGPITPSPQKQTGLLGDGSPYAQLASFPGSGPLGGSGGGGYGDNPFAGAGALAAAGGDEPTGGPDVVIPSGPRLQRSDLINVAAAGGDDWQRVKPLIRKYESGDRNIEQGVVGPQGGYNPSTGTVTGPSSASGYYQMIDPTWRAAARKAGIDTDKYPRAINAPEELQDKAAEALYREQGLKPWAPYNSRLAAATGYRGGGQDTVIPSGRGIPASALMNVADTGTAPTQGGTIPGTNMTPQGLAALNAMSKLLGHGDMFGTLLDTYYKSPGYLGEAETARSTAQKNVELKYGPEIKRAETLADLQAQIELKPKLEAAIAWAKIDPSLDEHQRKAVIDRESKRLEILQNAMTSSREFVVTPPGGEPRKIPLTNEQFLRLSQGKPLPEIGLPAMSAVQLGEPVERPEQLKQQEIDMKFLEEKRVQAESSRRAIMAANDTRQLIEKGVVAGSYADERTRLLKLGQLLNLTGRDDNERIKNTETYIANLGRNMKEGLKGLGPPVSNVDIQIAEKISGGQNLTTQGMLELLKMEEKYHRLALQDYDKLYKSAPKSRYDKSVKEPPTFGAPMADGPNGPIWYNGKEWVPM